MIFIKKVLNFLIYFALKKFKLLLKKSRGAILIEFAFAIPVLVLVLYFGTDVPLAYRISLKLQKTSELYAQMLINMLHKHGSKVLSEDYLNGISKSVGLTLPGIARSKKLPFNLSTYIACIVGKGDDKFKVLWCINVNNNLEENSVTCLSDKYDYSTVNVNSASYTGSIKKLKIQNGEKKLLIETVVWYTDTSKRGFNTYFYLLTIPGKTIFPSNAKIFGDRTAIITPHTTIPVTSPIVPNPETNVPVTSPTVPNPEAE
ncbi:MAG: hypothetical protein LBQ08_01520 [Holosporaceae bacterium]|jgi:hypothetical protein|nr:hypothetical protein [Holosporaceae bacterium]